MASRSLAGCKGPVAGEMGPLDAGGSEVGGLDAGPSPDALGPVDAQLRDVGMRALSDESPFPMRRVPARPRLRSRLAELGPLGAPDANGLRVPQGFRSRIIARTGEPVRGTRYEWHIAPDGGATYPTDDGGWIYVSNCEWLLNLGGVGAVRFAADGSLRSAYRILEGTNMNCAGGPTPWNTWLSCEEIDRGRVFECDPWGERRPIVRPALGVFRHEAATVDLDRGHLYLTEDMPDGRFYRYVPDRRTPEGFPDLDAGRLEVMVRAPSDGAVQWRAVPDPRFTGEIPTRLQVADATLFDGGEGVWWHEGVVYFSTKGDNRIWAYDTRNERCTVLYEAARYEQPPLVGVDNITVACCGDVLVAEDGGSMQVVVVLPSGDVRPLVQVTGVEGSEIAGPAFDPSGTRLYFSSQRNPGTTYEVSGPFYERLGG